MNEKKATKHKFRPRSAIVLTVDGQLVTGLAVPPDQASALAALPAEKRNEAFATFLANAPTA